MLCTHLLNTRLGGTEVIGEIGIVTVNVGDLRVRRR